METKNQCPHNKQSCTCYDTTCPNHGKCCECVAYHRARGNPPVCLRDIDWPQKK